MSKSPTNTRGKILDRALEMFNERGIEYVGLREIAADLGMRVSNITYYFPTKDDLVYNISIDLSKTNGEIMVERKDMTILLFLEMLRKTYKNQIRFRCLMLSFVHVMKQNKLIAAAYSNTQKTRRATIQSNLKILGDNDYLSLKDQGDLDFLGSTLGLISRFWISEAAISFRKENDDQQVKHYLELVVKLLEPYATVKGKKELFEFR